MYIGIAPLAIPAALASSILDKGIGEEEGINHHEAEACATVQSEAEHGEGDQGHQEDKHQEKAKFGVGNNGVDVME